VCLLGLPFSVSWEVVQLAVHQILDFHPTVPFTDSKGSYFL
jgi:hypothetical protein